MQNESTTLKSLAIVEYGGERREENRWLTQILEVLVDTAATAANLGCGGDDGES
ncbi:hypothetical protein SOVF_163380 [Spinacia oleracea]|nr:hypothetical protein SOVF_163380 [Spinacia oleracea]